MSVNPSAWKKLEHDPNIITPLVMFMCSNPCIDVCVCVCVRAREGERERERGISNETDVLYGNTITCQLS